MRRAVAFALVSLVVCPMLAAASDQPIYGTKLQLRQSSSGKQKLVFHSKGPSFPFPAIGGPDDPSTHSATIEIITPGAPIGGPFVAPANVTQPGWTSKTGAVPSYKYKRDKAYAATTSIKGILIKSARGITIQGDATGIPLDGARGSVAIRITTGNVRSCVRFSGAAVTKDAVGIFLAKNAPPLGLDDCTTASLTGVAPTCGDGEINQSGEECDGVECEIPSFGYFQCTPPGASNECECCADAGLPVLPCCNPSSIEIPSAPFGRICIPTGCTAPYGCRGGDQCQPDESCCSTNDGNLCIQASAPPFSFAMIPLVPCCPGLECGRLALPQGAKCCAAAGTSCAGDGDCCTGHCQLDGTCEACRTGGVGCGSNSECCSGSCSGGLCDACAPAATPCTSSTACCSGICTNFQCQ